MFTKNTTKGQGDKMAKYNEIKVGMKIGLWTILEKSEPIVDKNGRKNSAWICECGCEKHTIRAVREKTLKNGKTSSCGCTRNINKKNIIHMIYRASMALVIRLKVKNFILI